MHFNIYLDDATGERLNHLAEQTGRTRNSVIREAVADLLARRGARGWPEEVLAFRGVPDMSPFESHRQELAAPKDDPLA